MRRQRFEQRDEGHVDEDVAVVGVIDDVRNLRRVQPRIDRMAHGADPADAVVALEVPVAVPGDRRDADAFNDPQRAQRVREPRRPRLGVPIGVAVNRPFDRARDDLAAAIEARRVFEDRTDVQGDVHHQAAHRHISMKATGGRAAPGEKKMLARQDP